MRLLLAILLFAFAPALSMTAQIGAAQSEVTFKASTLNPTQLQKLFHLTQPNYFVTPEGNVRALKVPKSVEVQGRDEDPIFASSRLTVWRMDAADDAERKGLIKINTTVSQALGDDRYLVNNANLMLVVPGKFDLVEGSRITGVAQENGTFEYIMTTGANRRIRQLRLMDAPTPVEFDAFLRELKAGKTFYFVFQVPMKCPNCSGQGRQFSGGIYGPCSYCKGERTIMEGQLNRITW